MADTLKKIYSDIDFTFTKRPGVGDVAISYDSQAVVRSIRNLLLTRHFEKLFNPSIGSNLDALLFENASSLTAANIETEISNVINNFEKRANLVKVGVKAMPDSHAYEVAITFYIENATTPTTVNLILERNR
jgi:phage baseplate assembly protein W